MELHARLDRHTRKRVLCGRCSNQIADIIEYNEGSDDLPFDILDFGAWGSEGRFVRVPAGWVQDRVTGTWYLSRHAQIRMRRGQSPAFRRPNDREPGAVPRQSGRLLRELPCQIRCPTCLAQQALDPDVLLLFGDPA